MHLQHAFAHVLRRNHRGAHRLAHRMKLVVARHFLGDVVAILLKQHKVPHIVQKQLGLEKAPHHRLQLHLQAGPVVFFGNGAPGQHALRIGRERAHAGRKTIAHHQGRIGVEQVADLVLVGLQLVESVPHVRLFVGGVLQLHHRQGQTVDERDHIRAAWLLGAGDGELVHHQKVVVAGLRKVDEVHQIGLLLVPHRKLHQQTAQQQSVHAAVAHHHLRLAHRLQRMCGLLQRGRRNVRVDARQRREQALAQHHLPVVGALRGAAVGRDVRAVGEAPASVLKPAQAEFFELLLVQHVKSLVEAPAPVLVCNEIRKPITIKDLANIERPFRICDGIAMGGYRDDLSMGSTRRRNMSKYTRKIDISGDRPCPCSRIAPHAAEPR